MLKLEDGALNIESVNSSNSAVKRLRLGKCMMCGPEKSSGVDAQAESTQTKTTHGNPLKGSHRR